MNNINDFVEKQLFKISDSQYKKFQLTLMPGISHDSVIGVRIPVLRRYARDFVKTSCAEEFLSVLPHKYYDENNLHAFLIEQIKDFDKCVEALYIFLPYVDNWATCDMMSPKILAKEPRLLLQHIDRWISSEHIYMVRFAILSLMRYYLDDEFEESILSRVANIESDEYYINMARAWFFATALIKHYDEVYALLVNNVLDTFTHNKTIQKAIESYRISNEHKDMLRKLRRK